MAAPPTPVTSPGGPDTPEGPIILSANCAVVTSTFVCLDWQPAAAAPGGGAQVQLPTFAAIKAFVPFCRLSRNPADLAAAGAVNLLCVRLTDAAWSRLFTEMEAAQVFAQNFPTVDDLHKATRDAVYPNKSSLELVAADWRAAENFTIPAGNAAPAAAARRELTPIRFLSLLDVAHLEEPSAQLPLGLLCGIVGSLGPCLTQAARRRELSTVQLTAATLRLHLAPVAPSDALMANKVASFYKTRLLPLALRATIAGETELREELEDGIEYKLSAEGKLRIEEKRIYFLARG